MYAVRKFHVGEADAPRLLNTLQGSSPGDFYNALPRVIFINILADDSPMSNGGSSRVFAGRRGMSPLIATVLLMAFAVALGGMIMNWSIDTRSSGDCDNIKVQVTRFCGKENQIILTMRNDAASVPLRGIKLNVIESSLESELRIKNSNLNPGQPFDISVPTALTPATKVQLIGVVGPENNPVTCTMPLAQADPLKDCQ